MPGRGRPTKLDQDVFEKIVQLVKHGNYLETAAAAAGIQNTTLHGWLRRGAREPAGPFTDFLHAIKKAQAEAETIDVLQIGRAAQAGVWQASAWRLERRNPAKWGQKVQMIVAQEIDGFMTFLKTNLPKETYAQVVDLAVAFGGGESSDLAKVIPAHRALPAVAGVDPED